LPKDQDGGKKRLRLKGRV